MSGLVAALWYIITFADVDPKVVGVQLISTSTSPPAITVSPVAIVVRATLYALFDVVILSTTREAAPELEPILNATEADVLPIVVGDKDSAE